MQTYVQRFSIISPRNKKLLQPSVILGKWSMGKGAQPYHFGQCSPLNCTPNPKLLATACSSALILTYTLQDCYTDFWNGVCVCDVCSEHAVNTIHMIHIIILYMTEPFLELALMRCINANSTFAIYMRWDQHSLVKMMRLWKKKLNERYEEQEWMGIMQSKQMK